MQQIGTMHISDLFKVRQYSETYNASGNNRTTFYVESGMLLHYIYDNQLLPKVATYFELKTNKHVSVEDSIQQAFGMNAAQLDNALRRYIAEGRYRYYRIPAPASISKENYTSRPLTVMDANAVIADIHLHSPDYHEKAIAEFQEVLKSDSNNSAACRGLGYAYLQKQDFSQAAEYFRRASQLDSKDPRVHYYRALLLAREGGFTKRSDIPELTLELETSISIDPTFADSYALLAFAQNVSGDPAKALVSIRKALTIDPRNENYRFNLANALVANRQPDQALKVLQSLRNSTNPEIASRAAIVIGSLEEFQNVHSGTLERQSVRTDETPESELPSESSTPHQVEPTVQPKKWGPAAFVRGVLKSVDCSTEPAAVLIISTGSKTLQLQINDMAHVILIGADEFSCDWSGKKVAVNYRQADTGETSIISLELQEGSTR